MASKKEKTMNDKKRAHKATYARDKRKGGYIIRVAGPSAMAFAGREVPVTLRNGDEQKETLEGLIWTGLDSESGETVALYSFVPKPREEVEDVDF